MTKPSQRRRVRRLARQVAKQVRYGRHSRLTRRVVAYGVGGLVVLAIAWVVVTGLLAKAQLEKLQRRVEAARYYVSIGQVARARAAAADVPEIANHALSLTSGPAWWVGAHVPYLGDPLSVVRGTTQAAQRLGADAIPRLIAVATRIDPQRLRSRGDTVDIGALVQAAPDLAAAARTIDRSSTEVHDLPANTWLGFVNTGRARLVGQLDSVRGYVDAAARATSALPDLLGRTGPKRYFIGLQNEAELRGTGGLPGAFAIVVADHGTIRFTHFESDSVLLPPTSGGLIDTGLNFGPQYRALYAASLPTSSYVDSNVSVHFPYSATIWAAMWQRVSGEHVDGAVAVDPTTLAKFLAVTGPARLADGGRISASNVVSLTERDNYALFADNAQRKAFLVAVLRVAAKKIISGAGNAYGLVNAASEASRQHRLLVWTKNPAAERLLTQTNYGGTLPPPSRPLSAVVLNNAAGGKLDYYLSRSLQYTRTGCGSRRDVIATITLSNEAPASGLPPYVVTRIDRPPPEAKPGDSRVLLDYYATGGALLRSVTVNGGPSAASVKADLGHSVIRLDLELPRGQAQTIVLHLDEPVGHGSPVIWRQPGVTALAVQALNQSCG